MIGGFPFAPKLIIHIPKPRIHDLKNVILKANKLVRDVEGPSGTLRILDNVSLAITKGSSIAITGPSGSGKSTLISLLAGMDLPSQGEVFIGDQDLNLLDEDGRARLRAGRVGFVFLSFYLIETLTAIENVMLPLELAGVSNAKEVAGNWLERVGLEKRGDHYPQQLSGGEQQRVALSRAFAIEPELLFADEPTGNLDDESSAQVTELLFSFCHNRDSALILVTHDANLAARCARKLRLVNGQIVEE